MKKALRDAWCAALRSGEFKQGTEYLQQTVFNVDTQMNEQHYCCLGVLCLVAQKDIKLCLGVLCLVAQKDIKLCKTGEMLHRQAAHELGLNNGIGGQGDLADHNDGVGGLEAKSFPQLADYIEKHVPLDG